MKHVLMCAAAAVALTACQPAGDATETADAGAMTAEDGATPASASGGDVIEARVREGLWSTTMTAEGMPITLSSRICMDERMSALDGGAANQADIEDCDQTLNRTATGLEFTSRCDMGDQGVTETTGTLTGDFQTAYRMDATVVTTGAQAANGTVRMTTEARYEGPCPEGWRPGDMEIPGMGRVNVLEQAEAGAAMAVQPAG